MPKENEAGRTESAEPDIASPQQRTPPNPSHLRSGLRRRPDPTLYTGDDPTNLYQFTRLLPSKVLVILRGPLMSDVG